MERHERHTLNRIIRDFFDERAGGWDDQHSRVSGERLEAIIGELRIAPGSSVLDVGAGTGVCIPLLAPRIGPEGCIVAFDIAFRMMHEARVKHQGFRARYVQADVMNLPFAADHFDWVVCNSCFPHFLDQPRAVAQLAATLKPGGRLVVCHTLSRDDMNAFHQGAHPTVARHELPDHAAMRGLMAAAGLEVLGLQDGPDRYVVLARRDGGRPDG
ncbi:MAG TPA: class I SAM-dependent methyltransferase [Candidatus Hydrogenedentes bacterium]|nr:class I SAM-dependent methyltransferase [Candidatus Hydrogenedentota bacterium]